MFKSTFEMTSVTTYLIVVSVLLLPRPGNCFYRYDFIVVGSGAGGGAVARRLAESGKFKVLLVEAGGMPPQYYDVPVFAPRFLSDPEVTFQFQSTPQRDAGLINNGVIEVAAGRMLGGTTSLNYMWVNRGHPRDWDHWAEVTGDDSWKYENMLPYFKQIETYNGDFPPDQHGDSGPINVSRPRYAPGLDYWLDAGRELGYHVGDPNGPQQMGFTLIEFAKRRGRRVGSLIGYLGPVLHNPNLQIVTNTSVTQIILIGNRAVGVRFTPSGLTGSLGNLALASKEVILSAGAYNSPLILQRSGIGPREVLHAANITVVKEHPTGMNFQDHPTIHLYYVINDTSVVMDQERDLNEETWNYFSTFGDGPYSSTAANSGQFFMSSSVASAEGNPDWPDMQLCMSHSTLPNANIEWIEVNLQPNVSNGETTMYSTVSIARPYSRGSIRINPANILGDPILDVGYLRDPRDVQMFIDGILETLRIYEGTNSYQRLGTRYAPLSLSACQQFSVKSRDYWECYVRQLISGGCHPAGTNKMGRRTDPSAVVDSQLRVIGIGGLRIVDASVMPFIVNANPHAPVYAIAERAAEMILNKWI